MKAKIEYDGMPIYDENAEETVFRVYDNDGKIGFEATVTGMDPEFTKRIIEAINESVNDALVRALKDLYDFTTEGIYSDYVQMIDKAKSALRMAGKEV